MLIQVLFGVPAPATPRNDLVQVFLTGVPGLTSRRTSSPPRCCGSTPASRRWRRRRRARVGVLGGDLAGFPNGRRPGDDVVDIALRAVEGILLPGHPAAIEGLNDGALSTATIGYTPDGAITADPAFALFRPGVPVSANAAVGIGWPDAPVVGADCRWRLVPTVDGGW